MRRKSQTRPARIGEVRAAAGVHAPLAALAEAQHGVVSIRQLLGPLGYSESAIARARAAGRLHRLHRGVYAVGHMNIPLEGHCLAAMLACGPGSLVSHHSAAWLWGLTKASPRPFAVTVPGPRRTRLPFAIHFARDLRGVDRALVRNIPVTALPRTLLDYAGSVTAYWLDKAIERAEELELLDMVALDELLGRTVGHPGHGRLRRALELYRPPPFTRSGMELRFVELVAAAGLPRPATGFNELGHELDVYWPEYGLVVELDLFETHRTRGAFERDRLRQEDLLLEGIRVNRVTGPRLAREPERVIARVVRLLAQGGWERR